MLSCGFPASVPAHSVVQACISSNQAITSGKFLIILFTNFYPINIIAITHINIKQKNYQMLVFY